MTIANKSAKYKNCSVFMAGFSPIDRIDKYVEKLNEHGYIVPVWIQDEKVKMLDMNWVYIRLEQILILNAKQIQIVVCVFG